MNNLIIVGSLSNSHHNMVHRFLPNFDRSKKLTIYINSAGGDSTIATSLYLKLRRMKKEGWKIETIGDDNVKSGSLLLFLVGDKRSLYKGTKLMYHRHFKPINVDLKIKSQSELMSYVKSSNIFEDAKQIEKNNENIDNEIMSITNISAKKLEEMEDIEFDAQKALELGFATHLISS